jgi:hypothetical protein
MAGKATTAKPTGTAPATRGKPGPKAKEAVKPAATPPGPKAQRQALELLGAEGPGANDVSSANTSNIGGLTETFQLVEVDASRKVFLENMAHALIFDIFQMQAVLHAIRNTDDGEVDYFLDYYTSRLRPLLIEDSLNGDITALLDLGVWYALDGQEEILTEGLITRLGGDISATPEQLKKLAIEAVYGKSREESSRGERWMPALPRNSSREDVERCSPGHGRYARDSKSDRRSR